MMTLEAPPPPAGAQPDAQAQEGGWQQVGQRSPPKSKTVPAENKWEVALDFQASALLGCRNKGQSDLYDS